jgi:hypothetical protein
LKGSSIKSVNLLSFFRIWSISFSMDNFPKFSFYKLNFIVWLNFCTLFCALIILCCWVRIVLGLRHWLFDISLSIYKNYKVQDIFWNYLKSRFFFKGIINDLFKWVDKIYVLN